VPTTGPVRVVRHVPAEGPELPERPVFRRVATSPKANATPAEIVRGYLTAQADAENDHGIARAYLAPAVGWRPATRVTVYANQRIGALAVHGDSASVGVVVDPVGVIDANGSFRPATPAPLPITFSMRRIAGAGWRIVNPRQGVLLTRDEVSGAFQRTTLYWSAGARRLVAEPVFLPQTDQPIATIVRTLLQGPSPAIAPAVRSAIPDGTELLDPPTLVDGVVSVNISREIRSAPEATLGAFVAQVVWTLTEASADVHAVRFEAEGVQLAIPGHPQKEQRRSGWTAYAPVPTPSDPRLFFVRDGAAYATDDAGRESRVGRRTPPLSSVSANHAGRLLAAVTAPSRDGQSLLLVDATGSAGPRLVLTGDRLSAPAWDPSDDLVWVVRTVGATSSVVVVPVRSGIAAAVPLRLPAPVTSVRLSADGARVVVVAGTGSHAALWLARVERRTSGRVLGDPRPLVPSVRGVTAAAFDGASQVLFAVLPAGLHRPAIYRVDLDGYNLVRQRDDGLPAAPVSALTVSAPPDSGAPVDRVASVAGRLWRRTPGSDWAALPKRGYAASYPG
jgi:hypothetical protein